MRVRCHYNLFSTDREGMMSGVKSDTAIMFEQEGFGCHIGAGQPRIASILSAGGRIAAAPAAKREAEQDWGRRR